MASDSQTPTDLTTERFRLNMSRIRGLVALIFSDSDLLRPKEPLQSDGTRADILRTIVVFLHATFEDVLRSMARERIATATSAVLDKVPLIGGSKSGRAEKFHLGDLNAHRGKTVDQVIRESVENYLDRKSFGSCDEVDDILVQMGVNTTEFKPLYPDLSAMMKRRHRIVHEADLPSPKDSSSTPWTFDDHYNLNLWLMVVPAFWVQLRASVDPADELKRLFCVRWAQAIEGWRLLKTEVSTLRNDSTLPELLRAQKACENLKDITVLLGPPSVEEMLLIWNNLKSPDDTTTEEQARANLLVACGDNGKS